ncbi:divalent-cation tolerance protein CutA [Sphingomicrobium flavum]|uniref:divalent-cation tolerance protein CutA n=1 Tax=Sphingomicrobium flavum TaxID=1229164 RepID=UPI0021ADC463|nr:divalent-cation tolerance protein CutA [Sphingomicrobium flavum]
MSIITAYFVCASRAEAETIATALVEERLAACCNILAPCQSVYRWDGKVERAEEVPVIAKTTDEAGDGLIERVCELHSYDTPCITLWPIDRLPADYAEWVEENCQ